MISLKECKPLHLNFEAPCFEDLYLENRIQKANIEKSKKLFFDYDPSNDRKSKSKILTAIKPDGLIAKL